MSPWRLNFGKAQAIATYGKETLTRRAALKTAGGSLAALLASPSLARAAAASLETVSLVTADGRTVTAALARPAAAKAPGVIVIHEFWGLNDQIKAYAANLATEGYAVLAVDMYGLPATSDPEIARQHMQAVRPAAGKDMLVRWIGWLARQEFSTGKVATLGFCFGGAWSLTASLETPVDATVIYYGSLIAPREPGSPASPYDKSQARPPEALKTLKGPVLGHFAAKDLFITKAMVEDFERAMATARKRLTVYWYDADHAFANPTGQRYDAADAALAQTRTLDFLRANLA